MDRKYFNEYYNLERNHWWFKVRNSIIKQHIENLIQSKNIKILNIGAATGASNEYLSEFGELSSIEYDYDCAVETTKKSKSMIINASITELPYKDNYFDLICAFDVIEHVEDDELAVSEMKRVCKNNGKICVTVPAFMFLWSEHDIVNKHFRRYTSSELIKIFNDKDSGEIIYLSYFSFFLFFPISLFRIISKLIPRNLIRKGAGSDFTIFDNESFFNKIFYKIFKFEYYLLKKMTFPFGTSILFSWEKT